MKAATRTVSNPATVIPMARPLPHAAAVPAAGAMAATPPPPPIPPAATDEAAAAKQGKKQLIEKWGAENIAWGWVAIPKIILEKQHALGLEAEDINIILQIARYWYAAGSLPFPSKTTLGKAMNVHPRTVQRRLTRLQDLGFIQRIAREGGPKGTQTNLYSLAGLAEKATFYAREALQEREKQRAETEARQKRKRPAVQQKGGE